MTFNLKSELIGWQQGKNDTQQGEQNIRKEIGVPEDQKAGHSETEGR